MELNKIQTQELHIGIFLRKKMVNLDQQLIYIFELDVQDLNIIDFEADFSGSENISIKGYGEEVTTVLKTVQPRAITPIAQVQLHEGWKLKTIFRFLRRPISKEKQMMYIKPQIDTIETEIKSMDSIFRNIQINLTPIEEVNSLLEESKVQFVDRDFPPSEASILGNTDKGLIDDTVNHWRRPEDIYEKETYHIIYRINPKSLQMGKLKDYAFYSVISTLCLANESLIERLFFNQKNINKNGIYRLCLCKNGEWQTVNIDDYTPCQPLSRPKFASTTSNEYWINLLQKAYAKVHGRYLALYELQVSNVFNDLTGCPTFIIDLHKEKNLNLIFDNFDAKNLVVFYDIEEKQFDEDEFVALKNYAYPLVGYKKEGKSGTLRFYSHTQTNEQIELHEVSKIFRYACICKVQNWQQVRIKGKFISIDISANNSYLNESKQKQKEKEKEKQRQRQRERQNRHEILISRWYYSIEIQQQTDLNICLHQEDLLIGENSLYKNYKYVSIVIFQKADNSKLAPIALKKFTHNRESQFSICLKPGIYLVVPVINSELCFKKPPSQNNYIHDIFRKLDLLMRRSLKYADLEPFFKVVGEVFDHQVFEKLLKTYTRDKKGLGFQSFKKFWESNKIYWQDTAIEHYSKEQLFVLSFHSKQEINVMIKNNIGTQLNNKAHCELIMKYGKDLPQIEKSVSQYVRVKYYEPNSRIVEYMVENKFQRKIKVFFDCSDSKEYDFMPRQGKIVCELDSGEKKYLMKLIPKQKSEVNRMERREKIQIKVE